jgi:hypothetical protein
VKAVAGIWLATAGLLTVATVLVTSSTVTPSHLGRELPAIARASADAPSHRATHDEAEGVVDIYGNEVTDAIATYSLDPAGSLYELHSPQTEVPRLGSPKS